MGKKLKAKKAQEAQASKHSNAMISVNKSMKIDYHQPLSSPMRYRSLHWGLGANATVSQRVSFKDNPRFPPQSSLFSLLTLHDVDKDVGHSLVHFLYTGDYKTIYSVLDGDTSDMAREYRRSVLIYLASRKYGLAALEVIAQQYIQRFGDELSLSEILKQTKDVFLRLPEDENWFPNYVKKKLQQMLKPSEPGFNLKELYNCIDQNKDFGVFVLKMTVEILSTRLPCISEDDTTKEEPPAAEPAYKKGVSLNEYVYEEDATTNDEGAACEDLQVAEARPIKEAAEALHSHLVRAKAADLALYDNWGSISSKKKAKRRKNLASRGLPVPNKEGFISIYVG